MKSNQVRFGVSGDRPDLSNPRVVDALFRDAFRVAKTERRTRGKRLFSSFRRRRGE